MIIAPGKPVHFIDSANADPALEPRQTPVDSAVACAEKPLDKDRCRAIIGSVKSKIKNLVGARIRRF
jgi:hypothetical protein